MNEGGQCAEAADSQPVGTRLIVPLSLVSCSSSRLLFCGYVHAHDAGSPAAIATDMPVYRVCSSIIAPTEVANLH